MKVKGKWVHTQWHIVKDMDELQFFLLLCLPVEYYIETVLIPLTNLYLEKELMMQEIFVFLGCLFFMSCYLGVASWDLWWSAKDILPANGAPFHLNAYTPKNRFKAIMGVLRYTNQPQPNYIDKFHDV